MKKSIILYLSISIFIIAKENHIVEYSSDFQSCIEQSANPNICMEDELKYQDKKLNLAYAKAKKSIQLFRRESLRDIQRAWINYRNKRCSFFYHKESGSGGITDSLACELDMTIQRTKELKEIF